MSLPRGVGLDLFYDALILGSGSMYRTLYSPGS